MNHHDATPGPCIWAGTDHPRALPGRHEDHCDNGHCKGCLPCPEPHCIVCGIEHVDRRTCPGCLGDTRTALTDLVDLWQRLGAHAILGGTDGHLEAAGRIPGGEATAVAGPGSKGASRTVLTEEGKDTTHLLEERENELRPVRLWVFGWEEDWRTIREQTTTDTANLHTGVAYLARHLDWAAQHHDAFDAFAAELGRQVAHLEDVVHAGERADKGAPCRNCDRPLVRVWAKQASNDHWKCERCGEKTKPDQYRFSVAQEARAYADWLSASDMELEHDIRPGTLRQWAKREKVRKKGRSNSGRMLYSVADAIAQRDADESAVESAENDDATGRIGA